MHRESERSILDLLAPGLLLASPFVILVRHSEHSLAAPDVLLALAWLFAIGGLLGAVATRMGWLVHVVLVAALVTLFVDFQTRLLDGWGWRAGAMWVLLVGVGLLLRRHLSALVCVVAGSILATSFVLPVDGSESAPDSATLPPRRDDLPPIVHLILDEHIGIEGLPVDADPHREHAEAVKNFYLEQGFDVYGGAYAITTNSVVSISNLMNLNVDLPLRRFFKRVSHKEKAYRLVTSRLFEELAAAGYRFRIHQSDYLDFCKVNPSPPIELCSTYELETIRSIKDAPLTTFAKANVMLALYTRLSSLLDGARSRYQLFAFIQQKKGRSFPEWKTIGRVSSASVMPVLDQLREDLETAEPGTVYFAHLMLPHYPYAYDEDCALRPDPEEWLMANDPAHFPSVNSPEGRSLRYGLYLPQLTCTQRRVGELFDAMRAGGRFDAARIIVHGDHGSRIQLGPMALKFEDLIEPSDYLDAYSTLFAVKPSLAKSPGRYDARPLPVQLLVGMAAGGDDAAALLAFEGEPSVYMSNGRGKPLALRPLPRFAGGRVLAEAPDPLLELGE